MDLKTYLEPRRGVGTRLAAAIDAPEADVSQWKSGGRAIPEWRCPSVEKFTGGVVTCEELRPDVKWARIPDARWRWHAAGRPVLDITRKPKARA